ncbi:MAG: class I SAM-dependent methyltransferase [Rhodospirillales bacterium]|nr:class I SAM-dependent methyltransferase [Rhodospirillales bacterium]
MANWDKRYAETTDRLFGEKPNEYVRQVLARSDFSAKTALCIADGDGRNGTWLAKQGLKVTAIDISAVATEQALAHDKARGVTVERIVADIAEWVPEPGRTWDCAFMIYLQCEADVRNRAATLASALLNPGGWFIAEGFAPNDSGRGSLGPGMPDLLYERDQLLDAVGDLQVIEALNGWIQLDEGTKHQGTGWILRLLARRSKVAVREASQFGSKAI